MSESCFTRLGKSQKKNADELIIDCPSCSATGCYYRQILWDRKLSTPIPDSIVCLGLLTDHLEPATADNSAYKNFARNMTDGVSNTHISRKSIKLLKKFLEDISDSLTTKERQRIDRLCENAGLRNPSNPKKRATKSAFSREFNSTEKRSKVIHDPQSTADSPDEQKESSKLPKPSKEFTGDKNKSKTTSSGSESIISQAKKKAELQGREATIDPKFRTELSNKNHLLNQASNKKDEEEEK